MQTLIVFDLDGTLADTIGDITAAVNAARRSFGAEDLPREVVKGFVGNGGRVLMERATKGIGCDLNDAFERMKNYYAAHPADLTTLYPGVRETLEELGVRGFRMAVVTNKPQIPASGMIEKFGLNRYFDAVLGGGDRFPLKPDPTSFLYLLNEFGCTAADSYMVGDHWTDLAFARQAHVRSIFTSYGFGVTGNETPDAVVENFSDILSIIR